MDVKTIATGFCINTPQSDARLRGGGKVCSADAEGGRIPVQLTFKAESVGIFAEGEIPVLARSRER